MPLQVLTHLASNIQVSVSASGGVCVFKRFVFCVLLAWPLANGGPALADPVSECLRDIGVTAPAPEGDAGLLLGPCESAGEASRTPNCQLTYETIFNNKGTRVEWTILTHCNGYIPRNMGFSVNYSGQVQIDSSVGFSTTRQYGSSCGMSYDKPHCTVGTGAWDCDTTPGVVTSVRSVGFANSSQRGVSPGDGDLTTFCN